MSERFAEIWQTETAKHDNDERGQHTHQVDEPERTISRDRKGESNDVGLARAPIAVQNRRRPFPIDVARTFDVRCDQFVNSTKATPRDEAPYSTAVAYRDFICPLMMLTRLAVGLEPLNAPDAAHRSPRSVRNFRTEFGFPAGLTTGQSIKRNKELPESCDREFPPSSQSVYGIYCFRGKIGDSQF